MAWCAVKVSTLSNGKIFRQGVSFYRNNCAAEIDWDVNACVNEEVSASVVEINKSVYNAYIEHAWRLDLGVAWSNTQLQLACDIREKDDDEEFTQDNEG